LGKDAQVASGRHHYCRDDQKGEITAENINVFHENDLGEVKNDGELSSLCLQL
jgi:hypothetical protein